jgi:hypothetical protein
MADGTNAKRFVSFIIVVKLFLITTLEDTYMTFNHAVGTGRKMKMCSYNRLYHKNESMAVAVRTSGRRGHIWRHHLMMDEQQGEAEHDSNHDEGNEEMSTSQNKNPDDDDIHRRVICWRNAFITE